MNARLLRVSAAAWDTTLDLFEPFARAWVEGGCLWYGTRTAKQIKVQLIGVPQQINRPRNFEIPAEALAALNKEVPDGMEVLAQIHGHPGDDTTQSWWDDQLIVSRRILSLVLPRYGCRPCAIENTGIHLFRNGSWERVEPPEVSGKLIRTADQLAVKVVDLR